MSAYQLAIPTTHAGAGGLSWRYIPVCAGDGEAEYLLRADGALFGRGEGLYCEDGRGFTSSETFVHLAEGIADVVEAYVLRLDGQLICTHPEDDTCRDMRLRKDGPSRLLEGVRSVVRNPPNVFAVGHDSTLRGWGRNWRGSIGAPPAKEGDGIIHRVADCVSAVMRGSKPYQTYSLKTDGSLWHWAPSYGVCQPVPLDLELTPGSFEMGRGFPYFLDKTGMLRLLANEEFTFKPFKARWTEVMPGVLDFDAPNEEMLAVRDLNGALSVFRTFAFCPQCDMRVTFSGVAQYLTAQDVGVALRKDAPAAFFSVNDGIFSMLTAMSVEGDIARLDRIRDPRMPYASDGVFWAQGGGGALMEWAFEEDRLRPRPIELEGAPRNALVNGRFIVCDDSSVWEQELE